MKDWTPSTYNKEDRTITEASGNTYRVVSPIPDEGEVAVLDLPSDHPSPAMVDKKHVIVRGKLYRLEEVIPEEPKPKRFLLLPLVEHNDTTAILLDVPGDTVTVEFPSHSLEETDHKNDGLILYKVRQGQRGDSCCIADNKGVKQFPRGKRVEKK